MFTLRSYLAMSSAASTGLRVFFPNIPVFVKPKGNYLTSKGALPPAFVHRLVLGAEQHSPHP